MKFFAITTAASSTDAQRNSITALFNNAQRFAFWHWTADFWIIKTVDDTITSIWLRDQITHTAPGAHFAVFGIDPRQDDWAMYAPTSWSEWLTTNWRR